MILQCQRVFRLAMVVLLTFSTVVLAENDASALFLSGYNEFQNGERLERDGDISKALAKYRAAAQTLQQVSANSPDWQPLVVEYRLKKIQEAIQRLNGQIPSNPAPSLPDSVELPQANPDLPPAPRTISPQPQPRSDDEPATSSRTVSLRQELKEAKRAISDLQDEVQRRNGELKKVLVEIDRYKVSLVEKTAQYTQTQVQLENLKKDMAARAPAESKSSGETAALKKTLETAEADKEVLLEENARLLAKLEQASTYIQGSDTVRGTLEKERKELAVQRGEAITKSEQNEGELKKALTELAASREKIAEVAKLTKENSRLEKEMEGVQAQLEKEKKRTEGNKDAARMLKEGQEKLLEASRIAAQNKELVTRLAEAEIKIRDFSSIQDQNAALLNTNEELSRSLAAKDAQLESANRQIAAAPTKELEQQLAAAEKKVLEIQMAQAEKDAQVKQMQADLSSASDRLFALRADMVSKDTRITDLEKQLDTTAGELAKLKLSANPSEDQNRAIAENEVLRGVMLRQIREQARKDQAKRLIDEEISRLQVTSDSLTQQLQVLAEPFRLSDEEKKMFRLPENLADLAAAENDPGDVNLVLAVNKADGAPPVPAPSPAAPRKVGRADSLTEANQDLARQAKEAFDRNEIPASEKLYQQVVDSEPNNPYALSQLAAVQFESGKIAAAEVALKKTLELVPDDAFALTILGIVHYRQEKYSEAQKELEQAVAVDPQRAMSYNYLGIVYSQQNDLKKAEEMLQKAVEIKPDYADAHFNLAIIYATQKPPSKELARRHYQKATQLGASPDASLERMIQ